jgi:hypothetical protein
MSANAQRLQCSGCSMRERCSWQDGLDQFATVLVGTRSPYGVCSNALHPKYISGGSSSSSVVAVTLGMANFSLATP